MLYSADLDTQNLNIVRKWIVELRRSEILDFTSLTQSRDRYVLDKLDRVTSDNSTKKKKLAKLRVDEASE